MLNLTTPRLLIRSFAPDDEPDAARYLSDPRTMRYLEPPFTPQKTHDFLRTCALRPEPLILAVEERATRAVIGHVIFHPFDEGSWELGWVLRRDCWGQGFAGDLTEMLIAEGKRLGLRSLVLECAPEQTATRHIAARYGFLPAGTSDGCLLFRKDS